MDKEFFSIFGYSVTVTVLVIAAFVLVLAWMIWRSARDRPKTLDYKVESDLVCRVLNDALKKCGNSLEELPTCVEEHCQKRYTIVEDTLYYQWHNGKRLQSIGPLDLDAFSSIAKVAEVLARGKAGITYDRKEGIFPSLYERLRYYGIGVFC